MIKRRANVEIDQVQELLSHRYGIAEIKRWRDLLAGEYPHAMQILLQADAIFHAGRSNWLSQQNSFNDILTRSFIGFLTQRNLAGARSLVRRDGKIIKFGVLLDVNAPFYRAHPNIAGPFRDANERRNKLPGSHPYDEKGGDQSQYLTSREQSGLASKLKLAYNTLISFIDHQV